MEAAQRLGYQPNRLAQALVTGRSGVIAVSVNAPGDVTAAGHPVFGQAYAGEVLGHVERLLRGKGLDLLLLDATAGDPAGQQGLERWRSGQLDGVILIQGCPPAMAAHLAAGGMPAVAIDGSAQGLDAVKLDQTQAMNAVVEHLAGLGHRHLAILGCCSRESWPDIDERVAACRVACIQRCLPAPVVLHGPSAIEIERKPDYQCLEGRWAVDRLRADGGLATALVTTGDMQAFAALQRLDEHGLRCPHDLSVVGFDDGFFARWSRPALTSVGHDIAVLTEHAIRLLLSRLADGASQTAREVRIQSHLTIRASTGPPRT